MTCTKAGCQSKNSARSCLVYRTCCPSCELAAFALHAIPSNPTRVVSTVGCLFADPSSCPQPPGTAFCQRPVLQPRSPSGTVAAQARRRPTSICCSTTYRCQQTAPAKSPWPAGPPSCATSTTMSPEEGRVRRLARSTNPLPQIPGAPVQQLQHQGRPSTRAPHPAGPPRAASMPLQCAVPPWAPL
jgi:hypothetical protein